MGINMSATIAVEQKNYTPEIIGAIGIVTLFAIFYVLIQDDLGGTVVSKEETDPAWEGGNRAYYNALKPNEDLCPVCKSPSGRAGIGGGPCLFCGGIGTICLAMVGIGAALTLKERKKRRKKKPKNEHS
jgi:hypothetical protein